MRYKIVACILLLLSVFSLMLAAPVHVREVREAHADAVEGVENVIIVSEKRAPGGNLSPIEDEDEDLFSIDLSPQSPSTPDHASESLPGVDMPSSPSGGSKSPLWSKVSTPGAAGGTEVPLGSEKTTSIKPLPLPPGREKYLAKVAAQQSPSSEIEHASLSSYFDPPHLSPPSASTPDHASGSHPGVDMPPSPSGGSKSPLLSTPGGTEVPLDPEGAFKPGTSTGNQRASSDKDPKKVNFWHTTKVHFFEPDIPADEKATPIEPLPLPPGREAYLAKAAAQQSPSPEIQLASPSSYFSPPPQLPQKPQSKGVVSNLKTSIGKLGKVKFRPRFQRTVDTGA
jgi:hypothetical protein